MLALNSVKAVLPTKRQATVVGRSQVRNAISPRKRVIPVTVDSLEPRRMNYENPRGLGKETERVEQSAGYGIASNTQLASPINGWTRLELLRSLWSKDSR